MRVWKLLAVALWAAAAATAQAQSAAPPGVAPQAASPQAAPPQMVVVPDTPPVISQSPDGGTPGVTPQVTVVPSTSDAPLAAGDGGTPGGPVAGGPGAPDSGVVAEEEVQLLLLPARPPPPPEPPRQIKVTVMHQPRPRVEWGQAATELGISSGVFVLSAAAFVAVELLPITILQLFNNNDAANVVLDVSSVINAFVLPLAGTIAIDRVKAHSVHYTLEGWGWWATYAAGLLWQGIGTIYTLAALSVSGDNSYIGHPALLVFGALTPITQTVVAQVLAEPRDPLAPIEGMSARAPPRLLDGNGRPIPTITVVKVAW